MDPAAHRTPRDRLDASADVVAPLLLGWSIVRVLEEGTRLAGRIVETEAYMGPEDRAAHSYQGRRTARTEPMFAKPGTCYVYFTYGMHHCMNVVCAPEGVPHAVLIRALEPTEGHGAMRARRPRAKRDRDLCSGPAKLCEAMAIDRSFSAADLLGRGALRLEAPADAGGRPAGDEIAITPRIGIDSAGVWAGAPLRFLDRRSEHVSRYNTAKNVIVQSMKNV